MPAEPIREGDPDGTIIRTAKAAGGALNFLKEWGGVVVVLIGIGAAGERIVGKVEASEKESNRRFTSIEKSVEDFKIEVREKLKSTGTEANAANRETAAILRTDEQNQNAYNANVIKAMTEIVTTMKNRGMTAPNVPDPPKLGGQ